MAFTQQNAKDGYLFFAIAFNAVPGKVYAAQVVEAYEAGMTTEQIVNVYTQKAAFTEIYGADLSDADFAQAFVANVAGNFASATAQTAAIADIEAALAAGLSRGDVIYNVINNITNKSIADPDWGTLVRVLQNKVAVAQALTEGEFALDTTDVGALQAPLVGVDETYKSVEDAIKVGGDLKALLANAVAADKAVETYADSLGLLDANGDAITGSDAVKMELESLLDAAAVQIGVANYSVIGGLTATQRTQLITGAKTQASDQVALNQDDVTAANADVNKVATLAAKGAALDKAIKAADDALKAEGLALAEVTNKFNVYNVEHASAQGTTDSATAPTKFTVGGKVVITQGTDGKFAFTVDATPAQKADLADLLKSANDWATAGKATDDADAKVITAQAAVNGLNAAANDAVPGATAQGLLAAVTTAKSDLKDAQKVSTDLDKAIADLGKYEAQYDKLTGLEDAAGTAADKLVDAGYTLENLDGTSADVTIVKGLFIFDANAEATTVMGFGSDDNIYVGSSYVLNATVAKVADLNKGDVNKLEVFFVKDDGNTDVYVEQKAFGSNATDIAADMVKITLTGVAADKVSFKDGFITVAA